MSTKNKLSDVAKSISKGAEVTIKKSEELFSMSKIALAISSEEANIKDAYKHIGEKIYKRYEKGKYEDKELENCFKTIEKSKKEIRELKRQMDRVKNIKICTKCGCEMNSVSKFCPECGAKQ